MWETVVHLKCLSLMGMTLPSCVGKNVFVQFCAAEMNILSVIPIFPFFLAFFAVQFPIFLSFSTLHQRAYLYRTLLTVPAPLRLELHPINAI